MQIGNDFSYEIVRIGKKTQKFNNWRPNFGGFSFLQHMLWNYKKVHIMPNCSIDAQVGALLGL